jgi:hypothetical protein
MTDTMDLGLAVLASDEGGAGILGTGGALAAGAAALGATVYDEASRDAVRRENAALSLERCANLVSEIATEGCLAGEDLMADAAAAETAVLYPGRARLERTADQVVRNIAWGLPGGWGTIAVMSAAHQAVLDRDDEALQAAHAAANHLRRSSGGQPQPRTRQRSL